MKVILCILMWFIYNTCAKRLESGYLDNRIVGGHEAAEGAAPFQVSIQTAWRTHTCGGVIVSKRWIATAGHCVRGANLLDLRVVVGTNSYQQPGQRLYPDLALVHCMYNLPVRFHNDIALVRVNESIILNERTQIAELSEEMPPIGATITLTGWGAPEVNWPIVPLLQTINLTVIAYEACQEAWENHPGIDIGHFCTFNREGEGSCNGDSGGPLMWKGKLVGLVNWGAACAQGFPDMHASIVYYRDWIRRALSQCNDFK